MAKKPQKPSKREVELEKAIVGMAGYLLLGAETGLSTGVMFETLAHDIMGLARREECFCPRTNSYRRFWAEGNEELQPQKKEKP